MILIFQLEISRLMCICWLRFFNRYTYFCVSYISVISERIRHILFKWLSFDNRLNRHIGVMTYKILNGHNLKYMCKLISVSHNTSYNLRSSTNHNLAILERPKTNYLRNTFGHSIRMVWNGIPLNIKKSLSINAFKFNFKLFLQISQ